MVECELLDRLSILTYLAQYFQAFNSQTVQTRVRRLQGSISKSNSSSSDLTDSVSSSPRTLLPRVGRLNEPCKLCSKVVEIISRLNVGGRIFHRTCFKCARCENQLSLASDCKYLVLALIHTLLVHTIHLESRNSQDTCSFTSVPYLKTVRSLAPLLVSGRPSSKDNQDTCSSISVPNLKTTRTLVSLVCIVLILRH